MSLKEKNRCLKEEVIQHLIDGMLSKVEEREVSQQIAGCESCKRQFEEQKLLIHQLNDALKVNDDKIEIPEFMPDESKTGSGKTKKYHWWSAAALIILLFSIYLVQQKKPSDPELKYVFQEVMTEVDANKPWYEQTSTIYILDESGEIIDKIDNL